MQERFMNARTCYGGALYVPGIGPLPPFMADLKARVQTEVLWVTKRTARHEAFVSRERLSYSYGGKASCPSCEGKGTQEHSREGLASQTINCPACKGEGFTRPSYEAQPIPYFLDVYMEGMNVALGTEFNAIFLNKYDDEKQHLGWHADDFEGMRQDQPIVVLSLGAEREIWLKDKRGFPCPLCERGAAPAEFDPEKAPSGCEGCGGTGFLAIPPKSRQPERQRVLLEEGSLFIMPVGYQDRYLHRIPKHDRPCGWRISLTFRSFLPQP